MSTFTPTQWTMEPPSRPDHLSGAVLHSLSRPVVGKLAWGPLKTVVLGGLTFGILPLLAWPKKFGRFVVAEQQQLWHMVEWLRVRTGDEEAGALVNSVRATGAPPTLWLAPLALVIVVAANFGPWLVKPWVGLHEILAATFAFPEIRYHSIVLSGWTRYPFTPWYLYRVWTFCLAAGYASHWLHVRQHAADVNRLVGRINAILYKQHVAPVGLSHIGIGLRPLWLLAAAFGVVGGAWWAIPAALAGAVHRRYVNRASVRIRGELAQRVRTLLEQQRPSIDVPTPHRFRSVCRNQLCGKPVPPGALFCPRCGTRLPAALDEMA